MSTLRAFYCRAHNPGSLIIRGVTWSAWSHCGIVTPEGTVIEAIAFGGVVEKPLAELQAYASELAFKEIPVPFPDSGIAWARSQLGKPYDYLGVLGIGLHREWFSDGSWWCSELLEEAIYQAGRQRFVNQPRRVTPQLSWMVA